MQNMDGTHLQNQRQHLSDIAPTELNKRGGQKSARFNIPGDTISAGTASSHGSVKSNDVHVENTLDFIEDSVTVHSVKTVGGANAEDSKLKVTFGSSAVRNNSMKIRQVSHELKHLTSLTERPHKQYDRFKSCAVHALTGLRCISKADGGSDWMKVENKFKDLTEPPNGLLPRALFWKCIGMNKESEEFAGALFDALKKRKNITGNSINKEELKELWEQISDQSLDSMLQIFFDMVDKDANGRISKDEVREIISVSASANKLSSIQNGADDYATIIMEELDPDNLGYIMIAKMKMSLLQDAAHPKRDAESKPLSKLPSQKLQTTNDHVFSRTYKDIKYFVLDNWQRVWVLAVWLGIMAGLFAYKYVQYKNKAAYEVMGVCVCLAKGAAETLKFNMALILLPVCRNTITWLRNKTRLGVAVPFDNNIKFHQIITVGIAIGVGIHVVAHLTCDFPRLLHADEEKYKLMEPFFGKDQPPNYWWFLKGVEGVTGIIMVVLMAIAFTLASPWLRLRKVKKGKDPRVNSPKDQKEEKGSLEKILDKLTGFNAFWYSHHLFVIVYALLIVHGIKLYLTHDWYKKTTWMYLAVPVILYACERFIRAYRSSTKEVNIKKVVVYPENLLALQVFKPQEFKYKSGQYMFVKCAAVSHFEWHPFSITSALSDDYLSVHIRSLGDWTAKIMEVFSDQVCQSSPTGKSEVLRAEFIQGDNINSKVKVSIDGPFGAPAQGYKNYDVVLLIGLGIGATPMISIVKDIVNNIKAKEEEENAIENGTGAARGIGSNNSSPLMKKSPGQSSASDFKTRKAYFYWVAPSQGYFDWFKGVINEVTDADKNGVIEMHIHCTSVYEEGNVQSAVISMLQSIYYNKHGIDVVTGTHVKSHFAKPDWQKVYQGIADKHTDSRVGVFYCGPAPAAPELKRLAGKFSRTNFEFHKENF